MLRYGYGRPLASGRDRRVRHAGADRSRRGLVLIVVADQLGKSVGDMYSGAMVPGIVLALLYAGYVLLVTIVRPTYAPALPPQSSTRQGIQPARRIVIISDSAADSDLPGAGHHLHRRGDADRRRRHGLGWRAGPGGAEAQAHLDHHPPGA